MSAIGDYIAKRRKQLRLTQAEVSDRLMQNGAERGASSIAGWETGRQMPPIEIYPALATALEEQSVVKLYVIAGLFTDLPIERVATLFDSLSIDDQMAIADMIEAFSRRHKNSG